MTDILKITEQTSKGTQLTSASVAQLRGLATELNGSCRFQTVKAHVSVSPISLPLLSVKSELDSSLATISRELEDFFTSGQNSQSLTDAIAELHRVSGVLQMLQLRGLGVVLRRAGNACCRNCRHAPRTLRPCVRTRSSRPVRVDPLPGCPCRRSAECHAAPVREYQEILQARGVEMAFESICSFRIYR